MYDPVTLDQLRALIAVVEEGSFSAAARKLKRVQSAISTAMANLETQLEVAVWDRSTKIARLTPEGQAVVGAARRVLGEVDGLRRLTHGIAAGVEAYVSLCLDALFPLPALIDMCSAFRHAFPEVALRIDTQVMSAVSARVLSGEATLGVVSPLGLASGLERRALATIRMIPVVSPQHPLAAIRGRIASADFASAVQIVLSERSDKLDAKDAGVADQAVLSPRTWRVADLHTKHMMLRAGLGWGNLPEQLVRDDLRDGKLKVIRPQAWGAEEHTLHLTAVYRSDTHFGPAHRWILTQLEQLCARDGAAPTATRAPAQGLRAVSTRKPPRKTNTVKRTR
ncbi:MAG: lysR [Myxococcaceae bacterium]|nr:lysR [Myxococcaceae bacterium]